jgi:hypothetical protein
MRRKAKLGPPLALVALVLGGFGCNLSEEECLKLRGSAYEIINEAHTCNDDADCFPSEWPGCSRPASSKNLARVKDYKGKFDGGGCKEEAPSCPETPEVYCKQGLCVFRHLSGASQAGAAEGGK